jgi:large subunit ribosomal protein L10Ae
VSSLSELRPFISSPAVSTVWSAFRAMTSKLLAPGTNQQLRDAIKDILAYSNDTKKRNFLETIELQVRLKGYNIAKDKRFIGQIKLPNIVRPGLRIGILGDQVHCEQAKAIGVPAYDQATLTNFNKEKKTVKSWAKKHHLFLASESIVKTLNRTLGPQFTKTGKFPAPIRSGDKVADAVDEARKTIKFRLKKSVAFGVPVANVGMTSDQVYVNVMTAANYLVSLLKRQWQSVGAIWLKSTMGKHHKIY